MEHSDMSKRYTYKELFDGRECLPDAGGLRIQVPRYSELTRLTKDIDKIEMLLSQLTSNRAKTDLLVKCETYRQMKQDMEIAKKKGDYDNE